MTQDSQNLIWIDMEMSGLSPENDRIIEVALVVTDSQLNCFGRSAGTGCIPAGYSPGRHGQLEQVHSR